MQRVNKYKNQFWIDVFKSWKQLCTCYKKENMAKEMCKNVLWFNENFKVNKKSIFIKSWFENNVHTVNSLLDEEGKFMTYNNFINVYKNVKTNFLEFLSVTQAIKKCMRDLSVTNLNKEQEPFIPLHIIPLLLDNKENKKE